MSLTILMSTLFLACGTAEKDDTSEATAEATSEPTSEPASSPTADPQETTCSDLPSQECFECFANENASGYTAYANAVIGSCYCGTECEEDCTDFCASSGDGSVQPSTECGTCFNTVTADQNSACIQDFSTACQADADCVSFANDVNTCPQ